MGLEFMPTPKAIIWTSWVETVKNMNVFAWVSVIVLFIVDFSRGEVVSSSSRWKGGWEWDGSSRSESCDFSRGSSLESVRVAILSLTT